MCHDGVGKNSKFQIFIDIKAFFIGLCASLLTFIGLPKYAFEIQQNILHQHPFLGFYTLCTQMV